MSRKTTVGVFLTRAQAKAAIDELKSLGVKDSQIGLIAKGETGLGESDGTRSRWEEGTGVGAATGALAGLGVATAISLLTPIGPLVAGGVLVSLLAGAGVGAATGTIVGGLVGLDVPEEEALFYEQQVHDGHFVVTAESGTRGDDIRSMFRRNDGYDFETADTSTRTAAMAR